MFGNDSHVSTPKKNAQFALFLALMLGPFGMFYVTVTGAVVMLVINVALGILTYGLAVIVLWPLGARIAYISAKRNNLLSEQRKAGHQSYRLKQSVMRALPFQSSDDDRGDAMEKNLTRLRRFRDKNLISEEEFESKKRELMAGF